jgi:hypothetical protein
MKNFIYGQEIIESNSFRPLNVRVGIILDKTIHEGNWASYLVKFPDGKIEWVGEIDLSEI